MDTDEPVSPLKSLAELRDSLESRLDALGEDGSAMSAEMRSVYDDLVAYHRTLDSREQTMQGALVNLVDDMSQASKEFTETGTRLETILEAAEGVGIVITNDEGGGIIEFSRGAERIFGYTRSEVLGKALPMLCGTQGEGVCSWSEQTGYRQMMRRKSGELFPVIYSSHPLKDSSGTSKATLVIILDNSRQEMAERLMRESNERYMALALAAPISIITFDAVGTVTFVNDWHLRVVDGRNAEAELFLGKKIYELPRITHAGITKQVMSVLDGRPVSLEEVHVPPFGGRDEGWYNVRISPLMRDGNLFGGILIFEDITRRKRTELDLKQLIDSSPIPIFKVESGEGGGIIRSLNPEAKAMLGEGALNKPVDDYLTVVEIPEEELEGLRGDPCDVRTVNGTRQAIRTSHQSADRFEVQALMDVSTLIRAKEAAEEASRVKSDFIANMSHEIRTPLNVLLGMLQLLEDEELGEELSEMVEHATGAGQSLLALLNDILDFSIVEARALALDEGSFKLLEIVELIAEPYRAEAAKKGINFDYSVDPDMPETLVADSRRLRQALFHVTGNAVKFTDMGGVLLEAVWLPKEDDPARGMVEITVSDTGIGMDSKQIEHIFEPFRQADGTRTRRHGGTGIGLALVYEFVTAMGGSITVESRPGHGTRFRFSVEARLPTPEQII